MSAATQPVEIPYVSPSEALAAELDGPVSDAQLDAVASEVCRRLQEIDAELQRYSEAEDAEIGRIQLRYAGLTQPLAKDRAAYETIGREVAERADFGKKKSRQVGFGSYGRKHRPERVKILDNEAAVAFARALGIPDAVKVETVEKPVHNAIAPVVLAQIHATGEIPVGFEHEAERDEPWVKSND